LVIPVIWTIDSVGRFPPKKDMTGTDDSSISCPPPMTPPPTIVINFVLSPNKICALSVILGRKTAQGKLTNKNARAASSQDEVTVVVDDDVDDDDDDDEIDDDDVLLVSQLSTNSSNASA
jgi:hypothetical protein